MPACKPRCSLDTSIPGPTNLSPACSLHLQEQLVLWVALCMPAAAKLIFLHLVCAPRVEVVRHTCLCTRDRSHSHRSVSGSSELRGWVRRSLWGQSCLSGTLLLFQQPQNPELDYPGLADFKPQGFQPVLSAKPCSLSGHLLPRRRSGNSHGQLSLNLAHSKCSRNRIWCEHHI